MIYQIAGWAIIALTLYIVYAMYSAKHFRIRKGEQ